MTVHSFIVPEEGKKTEMAAARTIAAEKWQKGGEMDELKSLRLLENLRSAGNTASAPQLSAGVSAQEESSSSPAEKCDLEK